MVSDYTVHDQQKSIVVNNIPVPKGWLLEVRMPESVGFADRSAVLSWIQTYKTAIRQQRPMWQVRFCQNGPDHYYLQVIPMDSVKELCDAAYSSTCDLWNSMVRYGGK